MALRQEQNVVAVTEVALKPKQRVQLRKALKLYAQLMEQMAPLKLAAAKALAEAEAIRETTGAKKLVFEDFQVTRVGGQTSFFNKEQFVRKGGDLRLYNDCIEKKDKKPHTRITAPGEKEESYDE